MLSSPFGCSRTTEGDGRKREVAAVQLESIELRVRRRIDLSYWTRPFTFAYLYLCGLRRGPDSWIITGEFGGHCETSASNPRV